MSSICISNTKRLCCQLLYFLWPARDNPLWNYLPYLSDISLSGNVLHTCHIQLRHEFHTEYCEKCDMVIKIVHTVKRIYMHSEVLFLIWSEHIISTQYVKSVETRIRLSVHERIYRSLKPNHTLLVKMVVTSRYLCEMFVLAHFQNNITLYI